MVDFTDDKKIYKALIDKVNMEKVEAYNGRYGFILDSLSQKWFISLEAVRRTVQHTTH